MSCSQCDRNEYAKGLCRMRNLRASKRVLPSGCAWCGEPIAHAGTGRPRKYCSNRCQLSGWGEQNREHVRKRAKLHYAANRDLILAQTKAWNAAHPEYIRANSNARKSRLRRQTPAWADMKRIVAFYASCPPGHEVDHIIPLKGRTVSGLHVHENLQYLPMLANRRKGVDYQQEAA